MSYRLLCFRVKRRLGALRGRCLVGGYRRLLGPASCLVGGYRRLLGPAAMGVRLLLITSNPEAKRSPTVDGL
jgi:hypothetical protein